MTATTQERVVLIGAGLAAGPWLEALSELGCDVVAVATRNADRQARVAGYFPDARQCWPPEEAVATAGATLCINLAPPAFHLAGVELAARAGLPIIVEKPLELDLDRASQAVRTAEAGGIPLAVCFQYRYMEGARYLHELVTSGRLGRIRAATLEVPWWRAASYYQQPGRGTYARDGGGVMMTQAIHALDLLLWYLGRPAWVYADMRRGAFHDLEAEDLAMSLMGYDDGTMATTFATTGAMSGEETKLRLLGESATAVLVGSRARIYEAGTDAVKVGEVQGDAAVSSSDPMGFPSRWHRAFLAATLEAFGSGRPPPVTGEDGLLALSVIDAMQRSAEEMKRLAPREP